MKKRLISAAIMTVVVVPLLILQGVYFAIGVGLLGLLAYREIITLKKDNEKDLPLIVVLLGLIAFLYIIYSNYDGSALLFGLSYSKIALAFLLVSLPVIIISDFEKYSPSRALAHFGLIFFVGLGLNLFISIINYNPWTFLYLVSITMFTDTFAYIIGKLVGKHHCSKLISPNKTWEGCIGGSLVGTVVAVVVYILAISSKNIPSIILITLVLSIIGQFGDLFFSAIKREYKIKDFSNLIPGHGGVLDRIDSIIFVVIAYLIFSIYL